MDSDTDPSVSPRRVAGWRRDAARVDVALYAAIAQTPTPLLDRGMAWLSHAADFSRLSLASAGVLGATRGRTGRRAAAHGLAAVAVTASVVNLVAKPLGDRRRPGRAGERVPVARHVPMPTSTSFPSGHSAAAFAFAAGVGHMLPSAAIPLHGLAALVAYSRVHTGVHYPADTVAGALIGTTLAQLTTHALDGRTLPPLSRDTRPRVGTQIDLIPPQCHPRRGGSRPRACRWAGRQPAPLVGGSS